MSVLVDSSALYALLDRDDAYHERAAAFFAVHRGEDLLTHNYVILESSAVVRRRLGPPAVRDLLERLVPTLRVVWVDEELHQAAVSALLADPSSTISLVDQVSFELMRRQAVDAAFAFDSDFEHAGFGVVP